ncbi:agmatinase [Anseongella ginsenosidimutans]|uniref:Agmatinase n=1 Tax=Anseongella ginsenosidimutans TaxID=496056 RepID=A0A4R3KTM0_9SPHI|nr:agmatinase [Anseongella ginsenosidimutans]QEC53410.1 agmatinase [Anseongella ginsenosidimutans]TCS88300.1 agmatinase [Anseongella ginsenosidimutans]
MAKALSPQNFLGIEEQEMCSYDASGIVIQSLPYEYTSSYLSGSAAGPAAILEASHYVEFYDEELDKEIYRETGIATLEPLDFAGKTDEAAISLIENATSSLLEDGKFVVSLGAEHTVTYGIVKAFARKFDDLTVLQLDAHSDLREAYQGNPYSHASVMKRVYDLGLNICQAGIRAQCREEAELIRSSERIHTAYAWKLQSDERWMDNLIKNCTGNVYITIDADGFDPSVMPAVGTAEPGGLGWYEALQLLRKVCAAKNVVGFDIVECAPAEGNILTQFNLAKLAYKLMGYKTSFSQEKS